MSARGIESTNGHAALSADFPPKSKHAALVLLWNADKGYAFRAVIALKIPDVLAKAEAEGKPGLSAKEIVERLPGRRSPGGPEVGARLEALLEPLLQDGMFARSVINGGGVIYSSTEISNMFVETNESNILGLTDFRFSLPILKAFENLELAILDDNKSPFESVNGASVYQYGAKNSVFGTAFKGMMTAFNKLEVPFVVNTLERSGVLQGAKTLVDVGGGVGTFLAYIIERNPHIHGINFDMAHVISSSEVAKGVEQVGGNFFDNVPSGDVIILKNILHNYGDEEAIRILRKCFEALPHNGKVLIIEYVLADVEERRPELKHYGAAGSNLGMLALFQNGQERRLKQYNRLLTTAGFSSPTLILTPGSTPGHLSIIQAVKSQD